MEGAVLLLAFTVLLPNGKGNGRDQIRGWGGAIQHESQQIEYIVTNKTPTMNGRTYNSLTDMTPTEQ